MTNLKTLKKWSNPEVVFKKAKKYLGKRATIKISDKPDKKYMVITPTGKKVYFGAIGYRDFTRTNDKSKRFSYRRRSGKIRGNWKSDKYSANNLARNLLW
jgi:hypothetical protein